MSYDLSLFRRVAGEDPETTFSRLSEDAENCLNPGPIVNAVELEKKRLADALMRGRPSLEIFPFDYPKIAASDGISEAEARRRMRHIELNEEALTLQITL